MKRELSDWVKRVDRSFFDGTADRRVIAAYGELIQWVQGHSQFTRAAKSDFAQIDNADPWLIAYAHAHDCVVVTHEVFEPEVRRKVKIPNVCQQFGVPTVNTFAMLRELGIRFALAPDSP